MIYIKNRKYDQRYTPEGLDHVWYMLKQERKQNRGPIWESMVVVILGSGLWIEVHGSMQTGNVLKFVCTFFLQIILSKLIFVPISFCNIVALCIIYELMYPDEMWRVSNNHFQAASGIWRIKLGSSWDNKKKHGCKNALQVEEANCVRTVLTFEMGIGMGMMVFRCRSIYIQ